MQSDELGKSLIDTVGSAGGVDLLSDLGEVALDAATNDGILADIPILGSLLKLKKIGVSVRDHLFAKKLKRFLVAVSKMPAEERQAFTEEMDADPEIKRKVGETLISMLERFDEPEKAELLAKSFRFYLGGKLSFTAFHRIARAIDRCMVSDLKFVHNYERATDAFPEEAFDLASCGLIEIVGIPTIKSEDSRNMYKLTDFGLVFIDAVLREK